MAQVVTATPHRRNAKTTNRYSASVAIPKKIVITTRDSSPRAKNEPTPAIAATTTIDCTTPSSSNPSRPVRAER